MSKHRSKQEWIEIIESAARSGLSISDFCRQNNISKNLFYRNSLKLGYTGNGKRTQKWISAASDNSEESGHADCHALVSVPTQTVQMAWRSEGVSSRQPEITILHDSFRIIVGDNFVPDTLRRVLEVMRDA